MVLGFRERRLLLPPWMVPTLSYKELRQITLHECEHLRRHDDWSNLLLQIILMLFPLHPALAWLHRRIRVQRELACDAAVVAATARPLAYATCLTRLAEKRIQRNHLRLALAAWGRESELLQRVNALLRQATAWNRRQSGVAAGAGAVVLFTLSVAIARVPPFVVIATGQPSALTTISSGTPAAVLHADFAVRATDALGARMVPATDHPQGTREALAAGATSETIPSDQVRRTG